jgi:glycine cleavage system aminomethyltransferase T
VAISTPVSSLDKPGYFGPEALLAARGQPLRKKFVTIVLDDPAVCAWGGETDSMGGETVGELSSTGWGWAAGRSVALGCVRGDAAAAMPRRFRPGRTASAGRGCSSVCLTSTWSGLRIAAPGR